MNMKKMMACFLASLGLNVACAQANYENTDVKGFAELMEDANVVVLDVRTAEEFKEGHLEGAVNIDQAQRHYLPTRLLPYTAEADDVLPAQRENWQQKDIKW